ncbi:hypothetical protein BGZ65_000301, partial [Modicella reniformis]
MAEMMNQDQETFIMENAASLEFGPGNLKDIPENIKMHFFREFLLFDFDHCATSGRLGSDAKCRDVISEAVTTTTTLMLQGSRRIKVMGVDFIYKLTCIDLDPKKEASVPKYLAKDPRSRIHVPMSKEFESSVND